MAKAERGCLLRSDRGDRVQSLIDVGVEFDVRHGIIFAIAGHQTRLMQAGRGGNERVDGGKWLPFFSIGLPVLSGTFCDSLGDWYCCKNSIQFGEVDRCLLRLPASQKFRHRDNGDITSSRLPYLRYHLDCFRSALKKSIRTSVSTT